jgi:hypothetical protein
MRFFFYLVFAAILMVGGTLRVKSHETMGHFTDRYPGNFLWGKKIGDSSPGKTNCCTHSRGDGTFGDCKVYPEENVKIVPGGYLLHDGEFISHEDTNVSPLAQDGEYYYYRCKHDPVAPNFEKRRSHCFFAPPRGT